MRCPLFIGIPQGTPPALALPDATRTRRSSAGGWELRKGRFAALAIKLGTRTVGGTLYRVFALMVTHGNQRKVYRWLKGSAQIAGPFTRHNAPAPLIAMLRERNATRDLDGNIITLGEALSPVLLAGEVQAEADDLDYIEGARVSGDGDVVKVKSAVAVVASAPLGR